MNKKHTIAIVGGIFVLSLVGAWAVEPPADSTGAAPAKFDPFDPNNIPVLTNIDMEIVGLPNVGDIRMVEGLENESVVGAGKTPGETRFPRLILHGIFHDDFRRWRIDIVNKTVIEKREIKIDLRDKSGRRLYRIEIKNAWPVKYSIPPLSLDSSTRFLERMEFEYDRFEITD